MQAHPSVPSVQDMDVSASVPLLLVIIMVSLSRVSGVIEVSCPGS